MFSKILIANRGEIAVRIIRACKEMGIMTVAVYSDADADALHVSLADECVCIGAASAQNSYLNGNAILSAALGTGCEAVHPGYGFLSENADFAQRCVDCGLVFIGPKPETIRDMGDKNKAREAMMHAKVPVIPGSELIGSCEEGLRCAEKIGFPLMIKARAGGGGKGIRLVSSKEEFRSAYAAATSEAERSFGDGKVYLEKYISPSKHVEMQVLCDKQGNIVCLGERECSVQRSKQKLIEETPSPTITDTIRKELIRYATNAVSAVGYENAGTVEFLFDQDNHFYFMEMNTRLQVEHPVTEMVTGIDLVKWQIRIAAGTELTFRQNDISFAGSAIECRINAEDPNRNFMPSSGEVTFLHVPGGPWVRFDTALYQNYTIPPYYDSLIGKLVVYAQTREEAIRKMKAALGELIIEGVAHNRDLHMEILTSEQFCSGHYFTDFMETMRQHD